MEQRHLGYLTIVRRVLGYLRPHRARFRMGIGLTLLVVLFDIAKPWPLVVVLNKVLPQEADDKPHLEDKLPDFLDPWFVGWNPSTLLAIAAAAIVVIHVLHGVCNVSANYLTIDIGQRMVNDLRTQLYAHLQKLSLKFHYQQQTGDLLFRVMADTFAIQSMVMNGLVPLTSGELTLVAMFSVMVWIDWQLALVTLLVCPFLYLAVSRLSRRIHGHATASREAESELYSRAQSTIGAVKLVQAYGREDRVVADFRRGSERSLALSLRLYSTETIFGLVVDSVLAVGTAALVWLGAVHVLRGQLKLGTLIMFLSYLRDMYQPILAISHNLAEVSASRAGLERALAVLDQQPDIQDAPTAQSLPDARGEIDIEHVTFGYEAGQPVLKDINLHVAPGERIALVGRTGAGKSTLASLALRFFDPQQGRVRIDGHDLRDVTLASVRRQITLVLQEPILFHTTVADNVAFGAADADPERIREAARRAEAEEFILQLPQGYDTVLGDDGLTLSGGQRQRLALARALLRQTPIVILDEPTSSLDLRTEAFVWRNVEQLLHGKTAIVIAHRLSTARMADRIVLLEDGAIVEQGTHDELLAQHGRYFELWQRHGAGRSVEEAEPVLVQET